MTAISSDIEEAVTSLANIVAEQLGLDLLELKVARAGKRTLLRFTVDKAQGPDGVTIDECAAFSREFGQRLDDEDSMPEPYVLEVSSPGITRPFDSPKRYRRSLGKLINLWLIEALEAEGKLRVKGVLKEVHNDGVIIRFDDDHQVDVPFENIRKACQAIKF